MHNFWQRLWLLVLTLFRRIENHTKQLSDESIDLVSEAQLHTDAAREEAKAIEADIEEAQEQPGFPVPWQLILLRTFGAAFPRVTVSANREKFYRAFGRPMDVKDKALRAYKKTRAHVEENLPGTWNHNKPRLYMMTAMVPRFRVWLHTMALLGLLHRIKTIGCFNTRRIQFKSKNAPWSLHASAAAIDINDKDNKAVHAKGSALPMPFSKAWIEMYPNGLDFWAVCSLKILGFEWGGDWGRHKWMYLVFRYGVGYDPEILDKQLSEDPLTLGRIFLEEAQREWKSCTYTDPMHAQYPHERKRVGIVPWDDEEAFYPEDDTYERLGV